MAEQVQRKAVIKNADMSEEMQQSAVDIASLALSKYNIEKVSSTTQRCFPFTRFCFPFPLFDSFFRVSSHVTNYFPFFPIFLGRSCVYQKRI
jgi:hypothetical protein